MTQASNPPTRCSMCGSIVISDTCTHCGDVAVDPLTFTNAWFERTLAAQIRRPVATEPAAPAATNPNES
jgi:hypothetical protein